MVTLLEIARSIPELHRKNVCFVLFDLEEAGLIGSASYKKKHKREIPNQTTINALNEFYEMKEHPEKYKRYSSFKEAMNEVLNNA